MKWLEQVFVVTWLNLRTIPQRIGSSAAAVVGIGGVVAVFIAVLSIAAGVSQVTKSSGDDQTVIVLRSGNPDEMTSGLSRETVRVVKDAPGLARGEAGAIASAEMFVIIDLMRKSSGTPANVPLRGVEAAAFDVRRDFRILEGRTFEPGKAEILVGRGAQASFAGLDVGSTIRSGETEWMVVGSFEAAGAPAESELWCDVRVLQPAFRRGDTYQSISARLESPSAFDSFKDALTEDPRANVQVLRRSDYFRNLTQMLNRMITVFGTLIAAIMGAAAVFGAINTMYTAVATRTREIATLRALGFRSGPVVMSVLAEALVLAVIGGIGGAVIAYLGFNGYQAATMNWQSFSQLTFRFSVTPQLVGVGIFYASLMGLVGGLFPAVRAARMPIATALREL